MATTPEIPTATNGEVRADAGGWVLAATILGSSLAFIDGTVVNVALPALQTGLHATGSQLQWVVEAYALFLAALLLVGGALGDRYGRRRVFVTGVVAFAISSAWCGFAPDIHHLIAARSIQGIGAALLVPGSLALISSSFPDATRGRAIGIWSGWTAITAAVGPLLGGWLVQHASWRWVFFISLPIAVAVVVLSLLRVPEARGRGDNAPLDWAGAALATAGLGGVTYSLLEWTAGGVLARVAGALGAVLLVLFVVVESRAREPMLPLELFRSRDFSGANLLTLFLYGALSGAFFYLPLDLIQVQHYTPTQAGAALLPFIALISVLSRWSGGLVERVGARVPLIAGPAIAGVGFALLTTTGIGRPYWETTMPAILVIGFGMALSVPPLTTVVMTAVGEEYAGAASGVNNAVSRVGSLLALAAFGVVVAGSFNRGLERRLTAAGVAPEVRLAVLAERGRLAAIETGDARVRRAVDEAFVRGYDLVVLGGAGLCGLAAVCAGAMLGVGRRRKETEPAG